MLKILSPENDFVANVVTMYLSVRKRPSCCFSTDFAGDGCGGGGKRSIVILSFSDSNTTANVCNKAYFYDQ
jgi:hypothetical protein